MELAAQTRESRQATRILSDVIELPSIDTFLSVGNHYGRISMKIISVCLWPGLASFVASALFYKVRLKSAQIKIMAAQHYAATILLCL